MLFQLFRYNSTFLFTEAYAISKNSFDVVAFNIRVGIFLLNYLLNGILSL